MTELVKQQLFYVKKSVAAAAFKLYNVAQIVISWNITSPYWLCITTIETALFREQRVTQTEWNWERTDGAPAGWVMGIVLTIRYSLYHARNILKTANPTQIYQDFNVNLHLISRESYFTQPNSFLMQFFSNIERTTDRLKVPQFWPLQQQWLQILCKSSIVMIVWPIMKIKFL